MDVVSETPAGFVFSNLRFAVRADKAETRREKRNKFKGRDFRRLLEKAERRDHKLGEMRTKNPDKADSVARNIAWERAFRRATGEKVKDNVSLLRKGLRRKMKSKDRRKQKWDQRKQTEADGKERRMEKRRENVKKRREQQRKKKGQKVVRRNVRKKK